MSLYGGLLYGGGTYEIEWITPVIDRTSSSVYNATDVNRVNNNTRYLLDYELRLLGYTANLSTYIERTTSSLGLASLINLLEHNINALRDALGYNPDNWVSLVELWSGNEGFNNFNWQDANNLEQNLQTLKTNFENTVQGLRYCGNFNAGTNFSL
jgi:hypothetical protein